MRQTDINLVITDLDDTLWNWFSTWHASFSALIQTLSIQSGVTEDRLLEEAKSVHQVRGTSEYSFLVDEMPSLIALSDPRKPSEVFGEALHAQNSARLHNIRLYPGVKEALTELARRNVPVVAYTESQAFWTLWRMKKLGLDGLIQTIYSSEDHEFPSGLEPSDIRTLPDEEYRLLHTKFRHTPKGELKPSPRILEQIISNEKSTPETTAYIGDSLMKDMTMALDVGTLAVHAAYGVHQDDANYELLRRVTHWSAADVRREHQTNKTKEVSPTISLNSSFAEILDFIDAR